MYHSTPFMNNKAFVFLLFSLLVCYAKPANSQSCDCPYPIIFLHGFTGDDTSFSGTYDNTNFKNIFGNRADVFHAVLNANMSSTNVWGNDGVEGGDDDDVRFWFTNETNDLAAGCIYSANYDHWWNQNTGNPMIEDDGFFTPPSGSDSNESSIVKQGYALKQFINKVLEANPDKDGVIVVGHSMGGLQIREYLQRTEGGQARWWLDPSSPDGHKVIKAVTTSTPHLGSDFFGNPWFDGHSDDSENRDGTPNIFSEATRDLRYSYAFNPADPFNCGFFSSCAGPYLYGGNEDQPWGYYNEDVNCDGDEEGDDAITGINVGSGNSWNGTYDNPAMPLPTNLRYTWLTSDIAIDSGDGVVLWSRQWLYDGNTPRPTDGVSQRLTDTLLTNKNHLAVDDDPTAVIRGLDEGDYPKFAWTLQPEVDYNGLTQVRSQATSEAPSNSDPDWYKVAIPSNATTDLELRITPHPSLSGQIDAFPSSPADYAAMNTSSSHQLSFSTGSALQILTIPTGSYTAGSDLYFRVIHNNVGYNSWVTPYCIKLTVTAQLPVEWLSFDARPIKEKVSLDWAVGSEINNNHYEVEHSKNGADFILLDRVNLINNNEATKHYQYLHQSPNPGLNYYRIKQIDRDDSYSFSEVKVVSFEKGSFQVLNLYPNPANTQLNLNVDFPATGKIQLRILNVLGQALWAEERAVVKGINRMGIQLPAIPAGVYALELNQDGVVVQRMFGKD